MKPGGQLPDVGPAVAQLAQCDEERHRVQDPAVGGPGHWERQWLRAAHSGECLELHGRLALELIGEGAPRHAPGAAGGSPGQSPGPRAPRLAGREVAAGHARVAQLADSRVGREIGLEELRAPDVAVVTVAGAVERDPDDALGDAVFGEHRGDVRVMMLDGNDPLEPKVARYAG